MTPREFRENKNWNKADFFKGEYDIDLNSIDEYAEAYHQAKLKLLGIGGVINSLTLEDITKIVNAFTDINIPIDAVKEEIELNYL